MDGQPILSDNTFVQAAEVWVPKDGQLVFSSGDYGALTGFGEASRETTFAKGEGLPGKAWAEARPVVLKGFDGSYFKRTEAANAAGLTAAVAIPVFSDDTLKAVLVVLCADDHARIGAVEAWIEDDSGMLTLEDGYYGAAQEFEFVSRHTHFPRGQGLPGAVWSAQTPILMRDLGSAYRFIRASAAGAAGLTTGLGFPVPVPGEKTYVLTLLSALGTPIAHRFEIWKAREERQGFPAQGALLDGICARDGALWRDDGSGDPGTRPRATGWRGPIGQVLGSGLPVAAGRAAGLPAGYSSFVGLPIHTDGALSHVVAWYF